MKRLRLLVVHGAMPFGFVPVMEEGDHYQYYDDHHDLRPRPPRHDHLNHRQFDVNGREGTGQRMYGTRDRLVLPDLITSNTPPPSPLRRTRSCHAFFPETPPPTHQLPPTPPLTPASPRPEEGATGVARDSNNNDQVRRQVGEAEDPLPPAPPLPQLSWPLPPVPRRPPAPREEEERQRRWRHMGSDLRKIADQFQVTHAKVKTKSGGKENEKEKRGEEDESEGKDGDRKDEEEQVEGAVSISIPTALTRCLSASLILLVCWRLVSRY